MSRHGIHCPGDSISYNCSITSNTENLHLTWTVTFPGLQPIYFTYNSTSPTYETDYLNMNISVTLRGYHATATSEFVNEAYIESVLTFTVLKNVTMNETKLECSIADLHNDTALLFINSSGKCLC